MSRNMTEQDKKRVAEIIGNLRAIEENRRNLLEAEDHLKRLLMLKEYFSTGFENKKITKEDYDEGIRVLNEQFKTMEEVSPDFIRSELAIEEDYALSLINNASEEAVPDEVAGHIIEAIKSDDIFDADELKDMILDGNVPQETLDEIEEIEGKIDIAEPSKEIIKSFRTMARAITAALDKIKEAISILDNYLQGQNIEVEAKAKKETIIEQAIAKTETEKESPETTEVPSAPKTVNVNEEKVVENNNKEEKEVSPELADVPPIEELEEETEAVAQDGKKTEEELEEDKIIKVVPKNIKKPSIIPILTNEEDLHPDHEEHHNRHETVGPGY